MDYLSLFQIQRNLGVFTNLNELNLINKSEGIDIEKGKKAQINETRIWQGKKMRKQPDGSWVEIHDDKNLKQVDEKSKTILSDEVEWEENRKNVEKNIEDKLLSLGYHSTFLDDYMDNTSPDKATTIYLGFTTEGDMVGKTIKLPKRDKFTVKSILEKLQDSKVYESFTDNFRNLLRKEGFSDGLTVYPTTYGVGVFVGFGFKDRIDSLKNKIQKILDSYDLNYSTEFSDAQMVFRYKISKSKQNINKLNNL